MGIDVAIAVQTLVGGWAEGRVDGRAALPRGWGATSRLRSKSWCRYQSNSTKASLLTEQLVWQLLCRYFDRANAIACAFKDAANLVKLISLQGQW